MAEKEGIKSLPYGQSGFIDLRNEGMYCVDKTQYITALEEYEYQMFLPKAETGGVLGDMPRKRRSYTVEFKAQVASEVLYRGDTEKKLIMTIKTK